MTTPIMAMPWFRVVNHATPSTMIRPVVMMVTNNVVRPVAGLIIPDYGTYQKNKQSFSLMVVSVHIINEYSFLSPFLTLYELTCTHRRILTRQPNPSDELVEEVRSIARQKGFSTTAEVLFDVEQTDCGYDDIPATAIANGSFTTLVAALEIADLVEALSQPNGDCK